jgi:hypothetical protein
MTARRFLPAARMVQGILPRILQAQGLDAPITRWVLTEEGNQGWLFAVFEPRPEEILSDYTSRKLIEELKSALQERPIVALPAPPHRYAVLLSDQAFLPEIAHYSGSTPGSLQLGINAASDRIGIPWSQLGHVWIVGTPGFGRTNFLSLIAGQALEDGFIVTLTGRGDLPLRKTQRFRTPPRGIIQSSFELIEGVYQELESRGSKFAAIPDWPEDLEAYNSLVPVPLPPILLIIDDPETLLAIDQKSNTDLKRQISAIVQHGHRYGIQIILAGKTHSGIPGEIRNHLISRFCLSVMDELISIQVIGRKGAEKITTPGRVISDRWGALQLYLYNSRNV